MTLTQTVDIPVDRRLHLDWEIPHEIPSGKAQIELKVISFPVKKEEKTTNTNLKTPHTDRLLSLLSNIGEVNIDEIRDERLAKHL